MPVDSDDDSDVGPMTPRAADELRQSEYVSETPCFDGLFARYDMGQGYVLSVLTHSITD
ncbi:hypothetical protein PINS_up008486 [Pythium insidiosum]|nr:hypothetical protein PINS_up008486 [Pythium insidiosum]